MRECRGCRPLCRCPAPPPLLPPVARPGVTAQAMKKRLDSDRKRLGTTSAAVLEYEYKRTLKKYNDVSGKFQKVEHSYERLTKALKERRHRCRLQVLNQQGLTKGVLYSKSGLARGRIRRISPRGRGSQPEEEA